MKNCFERGSCCRPFWVTHELALIEGHTTHEDLAVADRSGEGRKRGADERELDAKRVEHAIDLGAKIAAAGRIDFLVEAARTEATERLGCYDSALARLGR